MRKLFEKSYRNTNTIILKQYLGTTPKIQTDYHIHRLTYNPEQIHQHNKVSKKLMESLHLQIQLIIKRMIQLYAATAMHTQNAATKPPMPEER